MISISLCGLLVIHFGLWLYGVCFAGSIVSSLVCGLCLESVYLGFMNFLFLT